MTVSGNTLRLQFCAPPLNYSNLAR